MPSPLRFETRAIHDGQAPDPTTGAVIPPIYQTSTYVQQAPGEHRGYDYSRTANPTRTALEQALASLEEAEYGLAFASGMAAITAVALLLSPGDHVVAPDDVYGGTHRLFVRVLQRYGIEATFVDMRQVPAVASGSCAPGSSSPGFLLDCAVAPSPSPPNRSHATLPFLRTMLLQIGRPCDCEAKDAEETLAL